MRSSLREAHRGVTEDLRNPQSRSVNLPRRISADYTKAYQQHGQRFLGLLGSDERFELQAKWKQREITRYSKTVGKALTETMKADREKWSAKLAAEETRVKAERAAGRRAPTLATVRQEAKAKWVEHLQYKQGQLDEILEARASMEAQTDILVHSGLVNPEKDRVMFFTGSPNPCELCQEITNGNPYTVEQSRAIGGKAHPNCLLPGTRVVARGVLRGYAVAYDGPAVRLTLASGLQLAVTENHQLLTRHGFTAANALCEGDDLLCCPSFERMGAVDPDDHNGPACIEDIVNALAVAGRMARVSVPVAPEDFHGDGGSMKGEIDIVASDGLLGCRAVAARFEHRSARVFQGRYADTEALASGSRLESLGWGPFDTANSGVGSSGQGETACDACPLHAQDIGLARRPFYRARLAKVSADDAIRNFQVLGDALAGLARLIPENDLLRVEHWASTLLDDPSFLQGAAHEGMRDAEVAGDMTQRVAPLVACDKIVKVERLTFIGHVYDLQTDSSLYLAEGIASGNCRDEWFGLAPLGKRTEGLPSPLQKHLAEQWQVAKPVLTVAAQKVRDGSAKVWTGQSLTPAAGRAVDKERELRPMRDLWQRIPGYAARVNAKQPGIPGG